AHWGSLGVPGVELPTVAVLGGGVRVIYPKSHSRLAREILSNNGLIISEYPPDATPRPHTFLERNRIIAGLAQGVIVIQAGKRSGALVTARNALDIGRDVYVVPGSIHNPLYEGSNRFIQDGATPIVHPFEFLKEFGAAEKVCDANSNVSSPLQRKILCYLSSYGPTSEEKLCKEVHGADTEVEMALQELAIHDRVRKVFGGRYCVI
ncbi:MAG: DNA-processing protein DprA, partial [Bdellovibrionales bacterium]|nr:DNA-processing protein DprA [Bdellovibrionales bacterium]